MLQPQIVRDFGVGGYKHLAKDPHGNSEDVTAVFFACAQVVSLRRGAAPCLMGENIFTRSTQKDGMAVRTVFVMRFWLQTI